MRYRKLDLNDDYSFGGSQRDFYRDNPEAVAQSVKTRLLLWLGEFFLDTEQGTPFLEGILGKKSKQTADSTIQDRVLSTPNVVRITNYLSEVDSETRGLSVSFDLDTVFGPTKVDISNYANY